MRFSDLVQAWMEEEEEEKEDSSVMLSQLFLELVERLLYASRSDTSSRTVYEQYLIYWPLVKRADRRIYGLSAINQHTHQLRVLLGVVANSDGSWERHRAEIALRIVVC